MVKMVTGEEIDMQELGGARVHADESGSADLVARDEEHARDLVAQLVTYLPNNSDEKPPQTPTRDRRRSRPRASTRSCPNARTAATTCTT